MLLQGAGCHTSVTTAATEPPDCLILSGDWPRFCGRDVTDRRTLGFTVSTSTRCPNGQSRSETEASHAREDQFKVRRVNVEHGSEGMLIISAEAVAIFRVPGLIAAR